MVQGATGAEGVSELAEDTCGSYSSMGDRVRAEQGGRGDGGPRGGDVYVTFEEFEKAWCLVESRSFQPGFSVSGDDQEVCVCVYL